MNFIPHCRPLVCHATEAERNESVVHPGVREDSIKGDDI